MSYWYEPKFEDLSDAEDEIHIYLGNDENGNIYASVKTEDIEKLLAQEK